MKTAAVYYRKILHISVKAVCFVVILMLLTSCEVREKGSYLLYQHYPFEIEGTIEVGEKKFEIHISAVSESDISVLFSKKEKLTGAGFKFTDSGTELIFDNITIPLPDSVHGFGILAIPELFKLRDDQLSDVKVKDGENSAEFITDSGTITMVILTDGTLKRMEGNINGSEIVLNVWKMTTQN